MSRSVRARREAGKPPIALPGLRRHIDCDRQRVGETLEAPVITAVLGDRIKLALGLLDLVARRGGDRRIIGAVDDVFADGDQIAPNGKVMNHPAVIGGIDDRRRLRREAGEILRDGDAAEIVFAEKGLERDRRGELAGADQLRRDIVDAAVQFIGKMLRLEKIRYAVEGVVVDENRAEKRLFGLDIMRRHAEARIAGAGLRGRRELRAGRDDRQNVQERACNLVKGESAEEAPTVLRTEQRREVSEISEPPCPTPLCSQSTRAAKISRQLCGPLQFTISLILRLV